MKTKKKWTLHNYWQDGVTIELRYFPTEKQAEQFAKDNGYINYLIE